MPDRDSVINDLNVAKLILCNPQMLTPEMRIRIGQAITSALDILKEQEEGKPVTGQRYCRCGSCGAMLFEGHKYCSECGTKIDWSTS